MLSGVCGLWECVLHARYARKLEGFFFFIEIEFVILFRFLLFKQFVVLIITMYI